MTGTYTLQIIHRPAVWPGDESLEAQARFAPDFPGFDGHFPGHPILPGFVQLQLALDALHAVFPAAGPLREVRNARFLRPIGPGETVRILLDCGTDGALGAALHVADALAATFEIVLAPTADCTVQKS